MKCISLSNQFRVFPLNLYVGSFEDVASPAEVVRTWGDTRSGRHSQAPTRFRGVN